MSATAVKPISLDIACGAQKQPGWVGIDIADAPGVDIQHNLFEFPWPVESNSVEHAKCCHFVEHIPHQETPEWERSGFHGLTYCTPPRRWTYSQRRWKHVRDLWFDFWEEVHRVLIPGGTIQVVCPYYSSRRADQDPTHTRRICEQSFLYLDQRWLEQNRVCYPYEAQFEAQGEARLVSYGGSDKIVGNHERDINVVDDIAVVLRAKKPSRAWWEAPPPTT